MNGHLREDLRQLLSRWANGSELLLVFDCDGTLIPFAESPALAKLPDRTRTVLEQLAARRRVKVGIISARDLKDLKRVVGLAGIYYSGASGLEFDLNGVPLDHPQAGELSSRMAQLAGVLDEAVRDSPGAFVERKRLGATVHYRKVAAAEIDALRRSVDRALLPHRQGLRVLDSARAIEITPRTAWTKGFAVRRIFETAAGADRGLLAAGDEASDTDAFEATLALGGVTIGIGHQAPPCAAHHLPDPPALADLLAVLLEQIDQPVHR